MKFDSKFFSFALCVSAFVAVSCGEQRQGSPNGGPLVFFMDFEIELRSDLSANKLSRRGIRWQAKGDLNPLILCVDLP